MRQKYSISHPSKSNEIKPIQEIATIDYVYTKRNKPYINVSRILKIRNLLFLRNTPTSMFICQHNIRDL